MPESLITFEEASEYLRLDGSEDQAMVLTLIEAASGTILEYLQHGSAPYQIERDSDGQPVLDSNDDEIIIYDSNEDALVKPQVKAATMILLSILYDNPVVTMDLNRLPRHVTMLIHHLRTPVIQ